MWKTIKELCFKAGDKVRCVESEFYAYEVGKVYTLEDWYSSDKTYHSVAITGSWNGNSATWEKVEDMSKFKIGDKVKVTKRTGHFGPHWLDIGGVYEVIGATVYDKRGRVLTTGENSYDKTHPLGGK